MSDRLLLDSQVILAVVQPSLAILPVAHDTLVRQRFGSFFASVVSLWEISLKFRLGKLALDEDPEILPEVLARMGFQLLGLTPEHAVHPLSLLPKTKDPFDRMLLAQCELANLSLVTLDRDLRDHPLAWRPPVA